MSCSLFSINSSTFYSLASMNIFPDNVTGRYYDGTFYLTAISSTSISAYISSISFLIFVFIFIFIVTGAVVLVLLFVFCLTLFFVTFLVVVNYLGISISNSSYTWIFAYFYWFLEGYYWVGVL